MERHNFNTPVGRFVSGSLTERRDKDQNNRPIEPAKQRFEFGVAFQKSDPAIGVLIGEIGQYAMTAYAANPSIQARVQAWFQTLDGFSMKIADGDKPNAKGQTNQNTVGCYVVYFSTALDINGANLQNTQIDLATIKRGYFVDVAGSAVANGLVDHNAGVYMNASWVRLVAEGDVIVGGMSAEEAFGGAPAPSQLPPGARPIGSAPSLPASAGTPDTNLPPSHATGAPGVTLPGVAGGADTAPAQDGTASLGSEYPQILNTGLGLPQ